MEFVEGSLKFIFDDHDWQVVKYDEHTVYRERIGKLSDTKAVDFVGAYQGNVYLIEVKDFRQHRIENQDRLTDGELAVELGQKVCDTVAGIVGAFRTSDEHTWRSFARPLVNRGASVRVILWLENDLPSRLPKRKKVIASVQNNEFKKRLTWLTSHVMVVNQDTYNIPNLTVTNLPRAENS